MTLEAKSVSKFYGSICAVDNVSIFFEKKGIHSVIGPNGAGKSTLMGLLSGTLMPNKGKIFFGKAGDITHHSPKQRACQGIGRTFQSASFFSDMTVIDHVVLGAYTINRTTIIQDVIRGFSASLQDEAFETLKQFSLEKSALKKVSTLSYGFKKVLELASVLATRPKILLLDEPTAGLGSKEMEQMTNVLKMVGHQLPIMLVEHDMSVVFSLSSTISVLNAGNILISDTPDRVKSDERVQDIYLRT